MMEYYSALQRNEVSSHGKKKKKNHGGNLMRITKGKEPMCMIPTI